MAFLARHGRAGDVLVQLPADASARSYYRVSGAQMLLMQDSRDLVGFAAFVQLAQHLQNLGLSAPRVFAHDASAGLALIEDFGTETYGALLRAKDADGNATEAALYALAVDALVHLHSQPNACAVPAPAYDTALLLDEVSRLSHWLVPEIAPHVDVQAFDAGFRALWLRALAPLQDVRPALVLRDFHIDNLMLLRARSGVAACGLLDFQDAVIGAGEYDLASLLQDARRDLGAGLEQAMLQRYVQAAPPTWGTRGDILHRYYVLAAQRHTRLMGQFVRLMRRDGKPSYLAFMPRVARQMQRALLDANLTDISDYLDTHLPNWRGAGQAMAALS
jgi:aminoglycoside/choline kinase family phosphotransferase